MIKHISKLIFIFIFLSICVFLFLDTSSMSLYEIKQNGVTYRFTYYTWVGDCIDFKDQNNVEHTLCGNFDLKTIK